MAIPCKRTATPQGARQCSQNVQVIHGQVLYGASGRFAGAGLKPALPAAFQNRLGLIWKSVRALEISPVGQNLLDAGHQEIVMTNILSAPVKIERGVYLKMDWAF
ncbi:MAG: hypothetical protein Q8M09_05040 [Pseudomonadota bacterium]|nr:hypothetical protein [Pseudomonadota bacterium]MDP1903600.1 hypothetical protein [Pseudomonadota bacterium]MDP2353932.1 hypothetical protein [Pseudomonadota bacterium]